MKKIFLVAVLFVSVITVKAQVKFDALTFTPQMPKAGQTVSFKFDKKLSPLIDEKKVDILVYLFGPGGYKILEPAITQAGTLYSGNFKLDSNTSCLAFGFVNKDKKVQDNNAGDGYIIPVYAKNNQPVTEYYVWAGRLYSGYGERLFGMKAVSEKNLTLLEEGLKLNPDAKNNADYFSAYLRAINTVKKKDGEQIILGYLKNITDKPDIKEADYRILSQWYKNLKMKNIADSFSAVMKEKYPIGVWKNEELLAAVFNGKDAETKKTAFETYIKTFPKEENKTLINDFKNRIASAYFKEKNYDAFKIWSKDMSMADKASLYNNQSWNMALAKEDVTYAKQISYEATTWAKKEMTTPTEKKPDYLSKKDWVRERKSQYAMYGDTYAFILYQSGDYKNGYQYAKDAAGINEFKNAEYNERYSQLMVKVTTPAMAKKEIEKFVKEGAASSKTKDLLKELYVAEKKSDAGYAEYIAKLEMAAKEKKRADLANTMINEEAPKFSLKDLDGNDITLAGLKGKVVIVDFWATWCGPCIASMPAMKTALEQLKKREDVTFVFVDTWESVENKKQNAADFMKNKNYPFHVLLDESDKVVADFKVNGIPTKFVIDKTGNIRFKSVGFGGNDDELIDEVNMMVEMAAADVPVKKYVK